MLTGAFLFLSYVIIVQKKFLWRPNVTFTLEKKEKNVRKVTLLGAGSTQNAFYTQILVKEREEREESYSSPHTMLYFYLQ